MLKEQAISLLTQVKEIILGSESWLDSTHQPIEEAFSMAIEAIKQSMQIDAPNVLNALDTIYRQAAIEETKKLFEMGDCYCDRASIVGMLNSMPSAQPELHYCRECKWSRCHIYSDIYGKSETYWRCLNWDGETDEEGYCHEWERKTDDLE